jgi:23S rRNA (adenine2503-C2)-methyltransferase
MDKTANRITNIVFMGMGEPLANYDALRQAIEMLNSPEGFGLGARNMVVSTAGLVPQIKRWSQEKLQVGLAVSLHASDNGLRNQLVPINRKYPLEQLIPACQEYYQTTGRRLSFEYILFNGINDSIAQARSLARLIQGLNGHVNLIPANPTNDPSFRPPPRQAILAFEQELKQCHVNATLRESRGQDIDAGCGQLRGRFLKGTGSTQNTSSKRVR